MPKTIKKPVVIDARLTEYLVVDGGVWGRGATPAEAKERRPAGKLSPSARWYRVTPSTVIDGGGYFTNCTNATRPVAINIKTGEPLED